MSRSDIRRILAALILLLLSGAASAQKLGSALWANRYTHTLYKDINAPHGLLTDDFNPNAVPDSARYGKATDRRFSLGSTTGERASCDMIVAFVAAGGLPPLTTDSYTARDCSSMDIADARLVTLDGQHSFYDGAVTEWALRAAIPPPLPPGEDCAAISVNPSEFQTRLSAAWATAPASAETAISIARALGPSSFGQFAGYIRCQSPAPHPQNPAAVSAAEIRGWLSGLLKGPAVVFRPLLSTVSDDGLVFLYRRAVEARRGLQPGSLK